MIWSFFLPAAKRSRRPKSWPPRWNFSQHRGCDQRRRVFRTTPWRGQQGLTSSTKATTYPGKTRRQPRSRSPASSRCSTASCLGGLRVSLPRLWLPSGSWLNSFAGAASRNGLRPYRRSPSGCVRPARHVANAVWRVRQGPVFGRSPRRSNSTRLFSARSRRFRTGRRRNATAPHKIGRRMRLRSGKKNYPDVSRRNAVLEKHIARCAW